MTPSGVRRMLFGILCAAAAIAAAGNGQAPVRLDAWRILGPGGGGTTLHPTISPHDPKVAVEACDMTGSYVTGDGGESWRMFNLGTVATAFAFDPGNPATIYAGASAIFRSDDAGRTWRMVFPDPARNTVKHGWGDHAETIYTTDDPLYPSGHDVVIHAISVDRSEPARVVVAMQSRTPGPPGSSNPAVTAVLASNDRGGTWTRLGSLPPERVFAIWREDGGERATHALGESGVFTAKAGEWQTEPAPAGIRFDSGSVGRDAAGGATVIYATAPFALDAAGRTTGGIHVSRDGGANWHAANGGLAELVGTAPTGGETWGPAQGSRPHLGPLSASARHGLTAWVGVRGLREASGDGKPFNGVARTTDGGRTWSIVHRESNQPAKNFTASWIETRGAEDGYSVWLDAPYDIGAAPNDPLTCYVTDLFRTYPYVRRRPHVGAGELGALGRRRVDESRPRRDEPLRHRLGPVRHETGVRAEHRHRPLPQRGRRRELDRVEHGRAEALAQYRLLGRVRSGREGSHVGRLQRHARPPPAEDVAADGSRDLQGRRGGLDRRRPSLDALEWRHGRVGHHPPAPGPAQPERKPHAVRDGIRPWCLQVQRRRAHVGAQNIGLAADPRQQPFAWRLAQDRAGVLYLVVARRSERGRMGDADDGAIYRIHRRRGALDAAAVAGWHERAERDHRRSPRPQAALPLCVGGRLARWRFRRRDLHQRRPRRDVETCARPGPQHVYDVTIDPRHQDVMYASGFDQGAFRSIDRGETWQRVAGYNFKWGQRVAYRPRGPGPNLRHDLRGRGLARPGGRRPAGGRRRGRRAGAGAMTVRPSASAACALAAVLAAACAGVSSRDVRVWEDSRTIPTYEEGASDPNPPFDLFSGTRFNYPYTMRTRLTDRRAPRTWRTLNLENEFLRVAVVPDLGGHVLSVVDKATGQEMFYANPSLKFAQVAYRGAWASYGIEFNFPISHTWVTVSPVDFATRTNPDGSASIIVANVDLVYGMQWRVELTLRPSRAALEQQTTLYNRSDVRHRFYWWTNAAVQVWDDSQLCYPMTYTASHGFADVDTWPVNAPGLDLSRPGNHSQGPVSLFSHGSREPFMGIYHPRTGAGVAHYSPSSDLPAKKIWSWGTNADGLEWRKALSDDESAVAEIQAGLFRNQETYAFLEPHESIRFSEHWLPVHRIGGISRANADAVLHLARAKAGAGERLSIGLNVARTIRNGLLTVSREATTPRQERVTISPRDAFTAEIPVPPGGPWTVSLADATGRVVIEHTEGRYDVTPAGQVRTGPQAAWMPPPAPERTEADILFAGRACELEGKLLKAYSAYQDGLARFPGSFELAKALGRLAADLGRFDEAAGHLERALARVSNDAEVQYYLGCARLAGGDAARSRDLFEQAAFARSMRTPALSQLVRLAARDGRLERALELVERAVQADPGAVRLGAFEVVLLRRLGRSGDARQRLAAWLGMDPTNGTLRVEGARLGRSDQGLWAHLGSDPQRVLDVASDYMELGDWADAVEVLCASIRRGCRSTQSRAPWRLNGTPRWPTTVATAASGRARRAVRTSMRPRAWTRLTSSRAVHRRSPFSRRLSR